MKFEYLKIYNSSLNNAKDLSKESKILFENGCFARAYFLSYSALEEISKSLFAADVFTGFENEDAFIKFYSNHKKKISRMKWAHLDANDPHYNLRWVGPEIDSEEPIFRKRLESLYVDVDFESNKIFIPEDEIKKKDAESIMYIVEIALYRIWDVTENGGNQIGTKGFMK